MARASGRRPQGLGRGCGRTETVAARADGTKSPAIAPLAAEVPSSLARKCFRVEEVLTGTGGKGTKSLPKQGSAVSLVNQNLDGKFAVRRNKGQSDVPRARLIMRSTVAKYPRPRSPAYGLSHPHGPESATRQFCSGTRERFAAYRFNPDETLTRSATSNPRQRACAPPRKDTQPFGAGNRPCRARLHKQSVTHRPRDIATLRDFGIMRH